MALELGLGTEVKMTAGRYTLRIATTLYGPVWAFYDHPVWVRLSPIVGSHQNVPAGYKLVGQLVPFCSESMAYYPLDFRSATKTTSRYDQRRQSAPAPIKHRVERDIAPFIAHSGERGGL
jgi:hypothetical protein